MRRGPSRRGLAFGLPGVAIATAGGVWVQAQRVAHAPLPHFDDLDPSGRYLPLGRDAHAAERRPLRIVALGDSSVTGPGLASGDRTWIARIAAELATRRDESVELHSLARGGSRIGDVLRAQLPAALDLQADLYVMSIGANDAIHATPGPQFRRQLRTALVALGGIAPVASLGIGDLSVIPRLPRTLRPLVALRSAAVDRLHRNVTATLDRVTRVPVPELSDQIFRTSGDLLFSPDRFHPNDEGHRIWAELFSPFVLAALDGQARASVPAAELGAAVFADAGALSGA